MLRVILIFFFQGQEVKSIAHNEDCDFLTMSRFEMEPLSNPYPVTIIPRFGGTPRAREPVSKTASPKFGKYRDSLIHVKRFRVLFTKKSYVSATSVIL